MTKNPAPSPRPRPGAAFSVNSAAVQAASPTASCPRPSRPRPAAVAVSPIATETAPALKAATGGRHVAATRPIWMPSFHNKMSKVAVSAATALAAVAGVAVATVGSISPASAAQAVTVGSPNVQDSFARVASGGLGSAPVGGAWQSHQGSLSEVSGGSAVLGPLGQGQQVVATLHGVQTVDQTETVSFKVPALPTTSQGLFVFASTRVQNSGDAISARLKIGAGGTLSVDVVTLNGGTTTSVSSAAHPANIVANKLYSLQIETYGAAPVKAAARAWLTGATAPAWQTSASITSGSVVKAAGGVGMAVYNANVAAATVRVNAIQGYRMVPLQAPTSTPSSPSSPSSTSAAAPTAVSAPSSTPATTTSAAPSTPSVSSSTAAAPQSSTAAAAPSSTSSAPSVSSSPVVITPQRTFPNSSNTGVPNGTSLRTVTGDMTITKAGTVVDGIDLHGKITVDAPNVIVRNSIIRGGQPTNVTCLIMDKSASGTNLQITDSEIVPEFPSVYQGSGICGGNFTATRVNVHGSVDGIDIHGNNVTIRDSYLHDEVWYASDPGQNGGPSHCDGVQIMGGSNLQLTNNSIMGGRNSALQVSQSYAPVSNLLLRGNLFDYGTYPVKMNSAPLASMSGITFENNMFGDHQTGSGTKWAFITTSGVSYQSTGNLVMDTGTAALAVIAG